MSATMKTVKVKDIRERVGPRIRAGFGLAFVSFVPPISLVSLYLAVSALLRGTQHTWKAAIAICLSGFFTCVYLIAGIGLLLDRPPEITAPPLAFLIREDPEAAQYVALIEEGSYDDAAERIRKDSRWASQEGWALHCTSGIAKCYSGDYEGSARDFSEAEKRNSNSAEFHYFYAMALLAADDTPTAAKHFGQALLKDPELPGAQTYLELTRNAFKPSPIQTAIGFVVILIVLFTMHEYAHTYAAWKLGDDTAANMGRLSLNPLVHIDLIGSLLLPGILIWRQSSIIFGWAKPVPVNPANFADPRRDHMIVSFAGPAMNLVFAMICCVLWGSVLLAIRLIWPDAVAMGLAMPSATVSLAGTAMPTVLIIVIAFLKQLFYTALILGCLNLLPIPPLDGSWILKGMLPETWGPAFDKVRKFSIIIIIILIATPVLSYVLMVPLGLAWGGLHLLGLAIGLI